MPFSSFEFLLLLPIGVAVYHALWRPLPQRVFLMLASVLFVAFPALFHLWVLAAVVGATALLVACADRMPTIRGRLFAFGVAGLVAALAYFKVVPPQPLGISYYSFILIGFLLEARRGAPVTAARLVPMVVFLPTLLSGPIVRWKSWHAQFGPARKPATMRNVTIGAQLFAVGAFKKILIADAIAVSTAPVWASPADYTRLSVILTMFAFYLQVYADFSGYTDMARGVARMLGFHLPLNFRAPYLAATPLEFWSRWHMSLTGWIRDYVYTPLSFAAMRRTPPRLMRPATLALVILLMVTVGLWHGVSASFVVFGALHGLMICGWYAVVGTGRRLTPPQRAVSAVLFQLALIFSLVLFRTDGFGGAARFLGAMAQSTGTTALTDAAIGLAAAACAVFTVQVVEWRAGRLALGRRLAALRGSPRLFPLFVAATFAIFYMKGLTLEGVWISPADPFFNQGLERFIYFEF